MTNVTKESPLLEGYSTGTQLDAITYRLFFIFPLTESQVQFLNTVIYKNDSIHINYWSLTHTLFGMIWGLFHLYDKKWFSFRNYVIFHTLFEIWEVYAISKFENLNLKEWNDILLDTIFGSIGFWLVVGGRN